MARNKKAKPIEAPPLRVRGRSSLAVGRPTDYDPSFAKQAEKICGAWALLTLKYRRHLWRSGSDDI